MNEDEKWMALALEEARKGIGRTSPNPPVGAAVVKNGMLLGKGWHHAAGRPHAEREALADCGAADVRGCTMYVTLEPCSTHGRTPPCTRALIDAGVTRVVYGSTDPNPAHSGRADEILRNAGIEVRSGVLAAEADRILRPFFKVQRTGLPWVIWKTAISLDGRITRPPGEGQWLTGEEARADVQSLRSTVDAIITSGETVRRDRPALTIRLPRLLEGRDQPWRVILTDQPDTLPTDGPLFTDAWSHRTLLRPRGSLEDTLRKLSAEQGVTSVMIEAGGRLSAGFFEAGMVDEAVVYLAPILCGGPSPALGGFGLSDVLKLEEITFSKLGNDIRVRGVISSNTKRP